MNLDKLYEKFHGIQQHGFVCPLFFLRTKNSSAIGEYPDLMLLGDFAKKCGFSIIQLLPIFDTGSISSPYSSRTCYGLNPVYLSLKNLNGINLQDPLLLSLYEPVKGSHFEYEKIYHTKMRVLKAYLEIQKEQILQNQEYLDFVKNNESWLEAYCAFCANRDHTDIMPDLWDVDLEEILQKFPHEIFFHKAVQFFCHTQFKKSADYIKSLGLHLMGDIPILLSEDSAEMWTHRDLFDFTLTVGAPPDQFSKEGQSWGFPLIRFVAKPQACAQFWKDRVSHLEQYFSLYRIDHAVGFFRLWAIPKGKVAKYGFFFPGDDESALMNAKKLFEQLFKNSEMAPIAEDLGVIPDYVKNFIQDNKLCGTKVVRWERFWKKDGSFIPFEDYPKYSMATLSTHDTTFMFDEWAIDKQGSIKLAHYLKIPYEQSYNAAIHQTLLQQVHQSQSLFVINMIQEYLYLDPKSQSKLYRINDPSQVSATNWTVFMPFELETYLENSVLCEKLQQITQSI